MMLDIGQQPPRYRFFLDPADDARFAACPLCNGLAETRTIALVMAFGPSAPLILRIDCRFCVACDLVIVNQDKLEERMAVALTPRRPELIGQDYRFLGTIDLADWQECLETPFTPQRLAECLHNFTEEVEFDPAGEDDPVEAPAPKSLSVPKQLRPLYQRVTALTDAVCAKHLTDEYAQLCRELTAALCRKRPSPLTRGTLEAWACGILYTIGSVNFLFDKSQTPHLRAAELAALFGVSQSIAAARAKTIKDAFKMRPLDTRWCLPSKLDENPFAWMIEVNGFPLDARYAPRSIQNEALRRGLIPYIPPPRPLHPR